MKNYFRKITLFILTSVVAAGVGLYMLATSANGSAQGAWMIAGMLLPVVAVMLIADLVLRKIFTRTFWIWIIELLLLLIAFYVWVVKE